MLLMRRLVPFALVLGLVLIASDGAARTGDLGKDPADLVRVYLSLDTGGREGIPTYGFLNEPLSIPPLRGRGFCSLSFKGRAREGSVIKQFSADGSAQAHHNL